MSLSMNTAISNMRALMGRGVTYSMGGSRTGSDGTADCSGAVYASLNKAGAKLAIGNTDSLFTDLPKLGFAVTSAPYKYGDIFIFGMQGASSGDAGHTGIFVDSKKIIHCNGTANGVSIDEFSDVLSNDGTPPYKVYRLTGSTEEPSEDATSTTNTAANMDNSGEIEEYSYIGDKLCVKGWHFANDPTTAATGGNVGAVGSVNWNDVQSRAQFFVSICSQLGIPKNTTLALAANAYAESSLDPSAAEANGMGKGYFQWSYSYNWGEVPNHMTRSYTDAKFQIEYAKSYKAQWINNGYGSWAQFWSGARSASYLTMAWLVSWERAAQTVDRWAKFIDVVDVDALEFGKGTATRSTRAASSFDGNASEVLEIYDATNDKLLKSVAIDLRSRSDIAEEFPDVEGVEWSGIDQCITFENANPFYIRFVRVTPAGSRKVLDVQAVFFPHSSSRDTIGHDYCNDQGFLIELTDKAGKIQLVKDVLSGFSWTIRPNEIPSCTFTVPIHEADKFDGHIDCKVIIFGKMFDGIVKGVSLDKQNETAQIELDHKIAEWEYRQIPDNYTVKNRTLPDVFSQSPFLYSTDWYIDADSAATKTKVNYAFSRQNHLEALDKALELTEDIWWRVGMRYDRYLEIGAFGEKKNFIVSETGQTERHLQLIGAPTITKAFDQVFNVCTVYGEKSDSSQASLTLRDAYLAQQQQGHDIIEGFPIVILNSTANKEQKNYYTNITKIASNNSLEYAILDEYSINLEQGKLIEKTVSMNDVAPFEDDNDTISDEERAQQSMIAYKAAVKQLKSARRRDVIQVPIGKLPCDLNVLDRIYFDYHNIITLFDKCIRYCKKVYSASDDFFITQIDVNFDSNLIETNTLTLSKELYHDANTY